MKHEDYIKLTQEEKKNLITELKNKVKEINNITIFMVEEIIYPIIKNNSDIEEITLDPRHEYNDEGYAHTNIMPFINGSSYDYEELMEEIDNKLKTIAKLIFEPITIDVQELKIRFQKNELDNKLIKKHVKKQNKI